MAIDVGRKSQVRGPRVVIACRKCGGEWLRRGDWRRHENPRADYCDRCGIEATEETFGRIELGDPSAA